jgi:hypothetical protein
VLKYTKRLQKSQQFTLKAVKESEVAMNQAKKEYHRVQMGFL